MGKLLTLLYECTSEETFCLSFSGLWNGFYSMEFHPIGIKWKLKIFSLIWYQNFIGTTRKMATKKASLHIYVLRSIYNIVSVCIWKSLKKGILLSGLLQEVYSMEFNPKCIKGELNVCSLHWYQNYFKNFIQPTSKQSFQYIFME